MAHAYRRYAYAPPPGLRAREPRHDVAIVGAGPIGLALALELANHGVKSVVLDDNDTVSVGSRAICWSKRSLEILDRIGVGERCVQKGVTWRVGRTYHRDREVFSFDLQPEAGHKMPAFVNLQQYYVEEYLIEAAQANGLIDLRFRNEVTGVKQDSSGVTLTVNTPDGAYELDASFVVACDGAKSPLRAMLGLDFAGELFEERFLIADIEMEADFPAERRFWFEPEFHQGQSALLHKQPDNIYRIDLQLGWDADPEEEKKPERVIARIRRVVGDRPFRLDWVSVYAFQCRRLERFVHDRVIFCGDSAHVVSPFGARGGNGGIQDVDALGWRLAAAVRGKATPAILAAYDRERRFAADENIANSTRSTKFMTPGAGAERLFRDQVLALSAHADFARPMVNSGRLSRPCFYPAANAPDDPRLPAVSRPGSVAPDAPVQGGWLLEKFGGEPVLLSIGCDAPPVAGCRAMRVDADGCVARRYLGMAARAFYLVRPDQIVAARWVDAAAGEFERAAAGLWEAGQ
jgi:3-(3-hydroxy-phenyl)propionate hydroxylase